MVQQHVDSLLLPPDQALPEIEAILVALQAPDLASAPALRVRLLDAQHPPVAGDAQHAGPDAALGLERDGLPRVQPVAVVALLQVVGEAPAPELRVHSFEAREDAREQGLEAQRRRVGGEQVRDGCRRAGVDGVDADTQNDLVGAVAVAALREDAADLDVLLGGGGLGRVEGILKMGQLTMRDHPRAWRLTDVVWPL